ncbi:MAG: WbqC family protein [Balneola sp.]
MILTILTPQFAPNLYDLASILKSDRIIFTDVEKWSRKGRTHRAEIRNEESTQWINLPILSEDRKKAIKDVRLDHDQQWFDSFWNAIHHNYRNATYFDHFEDELYHDIQQVSSFEFLLEFNLYFFERLLLYLEIDIDYELASNASGYSTFPDECVKNLNADILFLEHQSKNYQRQSKQARIALQNHPGYTQAYPGFEKGCSVLDLLLNKGVESFKILEKL